MKSKLSLTWLFLTLPVSFSLHAQEHPIDAKLRQCMDSNFSTHAMIQCYQQAEKEWDKELNQNYQLLMSVLDATSKKKSENLPVGMDKNP